MSTQSYKHTSQEVVVEKPIQTENVSNYKEAPEEAKVDNTDETDLETLFMKSMTAYKTAMTNTLKEIRNGGPVNEQGRKD